VAFATVTPNGNDTSWVESQALTRAAPTLSTDGVQLKDYSSFTVIVEANASQTLSGAGTLDCWVYDGAVNSGSGGWSILPGQTQSVTVSGKQRMAFTVFQVPCPRKSRIMFAANGITVSSGTTVNVYILGFNPAVAQLY